MKWIIIFLAGLLLFSTSCSKDGPVKVQTLKDKLIGKWIQFSPCDSCFVLSFESNDTIVQMNTSNNSKIYYKYEIISSDSIRVNRLWEITPKLKTTKHKINFKQNDTIELIQFFAVDYGITGFEDIKLYKTK